MKRSGILGLLLLCIGLFLCVPQVSAAPYTGLWVGAVAIDKVSESQIAGVDAFTKPTDTWFPFTFRLIMHVDSTGKVRLLKDVIQMETGAGVPVLITDDQFIKDYICPELNGEQFCRRISTTAYDFDGLEVPFPSGTFSTTSTLTADVVLSAENPTNPFKHKFHPDHDNLDELGRPIVDTTVTDTHLTGKNIMEVYRVIRTMTFKFSAADPFGTGTAPGWGSTVMGGTFEETLKGLHKNTIYVSGIFRLSKVTDIGELNK